MGGYSQKMIQCQGVVYGHMLSSLTWAGCYSHCHWPELFHSSQPRTHFSDQGTVALDSTRDGQPCDFNQDTNHVTELFCIVFTFVEIYFFRHSSSCLVSHGRCSALTLRWRVCSYFMTLLQWHGPHAECCWFRWNIYEDWFLCKGGESSVAQKQEDDLCYYETSKDTCQD